jgi:hypothetical protein
MTTLTIMIAAVLMAGVVMAFRAFTAWGTSWGATSAECAQPMAGDRYLAGGPATRVAMTRAISIKRSPEMVWPWLAQLGRGAGWYSYDRLDNGGKKSAQHLVSWIPEPQLGDASPIGYLAYLEPGRELVWWAGGVKFLAATACMVIDLLLRPEAGGSRLIIRISADAAGPTAPLAMGFFQVIDTLMARRQLLGIKDRVEAYGVRTIDPEHPETGRRDQYQYYEVIYASGQWAGVPGKEEAAHWRQRALADKVIAE